MSQDFRLIPGVRQDHNGNYYQIAMNERGEQKLVFVSPCPLSPATEAEMQSVTVQSLAYLFAKDIEPKNEVQAKLLAAIMESGPTFQSVAFFQKRRGE